ncbi:hypothetical protein [Moraxella sp. ZY200743]|uniref:hypothetical protein n=1 Tax=Moraxella sp. ZY200743 TaxID=2911970 RepID=UPI003D7D0100
MAKFATTRTQTTADSEPAQHYVNIRFQGKQIGYITLDKFPQLVEVMQRNENNATALLQQCEGTYRERSVTSVKFDLDSFS